MNNDNQLQVKSQGLQTQVDTLLDSRKYFIEKVLPILQEKQDYYTIMNKKSLAKGGAEKLASIFNLVASFTVDKDTMELLKVEGLVAYVCDLKDKDGNARGQGRGADTLLRNQKDPNKTIKMAQKRAYVDAVIRATGLSDIFTQDLEDMPKDEVKYAPQKVETPKVDPDKARIKELCDSLNPILSTKEGYEKYVKEKTGFDLSKSGNYKMIIKSLERLVGEKDKEAEEVAKVMDGEVVK